MFADVTGLENAPDLSSCRSGDFVAQHDRDQVRVVQLVGNELVKEFLLDGLEVLGLR